MLIIQHLSEIIHGMTMATDRQHVNLQMTVVPGDREPRDRWVIDQQETTRLRVVMEEPMRL